MLHNIYLKNQYHLPIHQLFDPSVYLKNIN